MRLPALRTMILVLCPLMASSALVAAAPGLEQEYVRRTLDHLHEGRFGAADETLLSLPRERFVTADHAFLRAFVTYWRLLYDEHNEDLQAEFENRLRRCIALSDAILDRSPDDSEALFWKGSAHMLLAQLRAAQRRTLPAAFEAKKAYRFLTRASRIDAEEAADSGFGLGTYQYYADQLPAVIKGLRFLLTIPGGDREEGLARLSRAASESRYFRLEARLVLASIYAGEYENDFVSALREANAALAEFPETMAVRHGLSKILTGVYRPGPASDLLRAALRKAEGQPVDPSVLSALRFRLAEAEAARFRPDLALDSVRPMLEDPRRAPAELVARTRDAAAVWAGLLDPAPAWYLAADPVPLARRVPSPEDRASLQAAAATLASARVALDVEREGSWQRSAEVLLRLREVSDRDAVLDLLTGRALLFAGAAERARPYLERAAPDPDLPALWRPLAHLLLAITYDEVGERDRAAGLYREVAEGPGFPGRDAAHLGLAGIDPAAP